MFVEENRHCQGEARRNIFPPVGLCWSSLRFTNIYQSFCVQFFQKQLPGRAEKDPDGLMILAYGMKINPKRMKKLEKDYTVLKMKEQEEMVELRRLRAENRLLRQRTELLEAESAELADRLVRGQVSRAEEEETAFVVQRELAALRHTHLETSHQLEQAHEELRSLSVLLEENVTSKQSSLDEILMKQEALSQKEDMIQCLQEELVRVRLHEAENDATIRELRARIQELEEDKKTLRETTPDNSVAHLQEELIAVKLREAEANLSLKVTFSSTPLLVPFLTLSRNELRLFRLIRFT